MFSINREEPYDILAVGDWSQKLSFYQLSGKQVLVNPLTPKISLVIITYSPYCSPFSSCGVSVENLLYDQLIIP